MAWHWHHVAALHAGAISGAAACITSMPCDCVKTRIEMSLPRAHKPPGMVTSILAFLRMGRSMVRHGGIGSLYIGILPRLCDKVCSHAFGPSMHSHLVCLPAARLHTMQPQRCCG